MPRHEPDHELQRISPTSEQVQRRPMEEEEEDAAAMPAADDGQDSYRHDDHLIAAHGLPREGRNGERGETSGTIDGPIVRKLDWILLPFLALLFLLNSLDKSNIGNAETAGFTHDAGLSRGDVNTSMAYFFFVFVLLQPVGAALGRTFGMALYVPACMSLWGLSTIGHIFVRSRWQLIWLRIAIAILESGFYPTTVSYLSLFYTKFEFARRLGIFYGMSAVSGVLGGILSWAVFSRWPGDDDSPASPSLPPSEIDTASSTRWKPWQILFLVEGCTTMVIALIGFVWLPHSPGTAWFLKAEERSWARERMERQGSASGMNNRAEATEQQSDTGHTRESNPQVSFEHQDDDEDDEGGEAHDRLLAGSEGGLHKRTTLRNDMDVGLSRHDVLSAVLNFKIWHILTVNILSATPVAAFGVLLPILVKELSPSLKLSPAASNLLSTPPFAFGAIALFVFTVWSDRSRQRLIPIFCGLGFLIFGLLMNIIAPVDSYWARYVSLCILLSGSFIASPLTVAWLANNTPEPGKRAILLGINGWGNLAGVLMAVLFTPDERDTGYLRSFVVLLICVLAAFAGYVVFYMLLVKENRRRDELTKDWSSRDQDREETYGDVSVPMSSQERFVKRLGLQAIARRLGLEESRKGDDKLTFRYSL